MGKKKVKSPEKLSVEKFWGIWNVVEASILMIAGLMAIIVGAISVSNPNDQGLQDVAGNLGNVIPFVIGIFVVMDAAMRVIISFTKFQKQTDESAMLIGAFEATIGIILMIFFRNFTELVADFVAIFMICIGLLLIIFSVFAIKSRRSKIFIPILEIFFSAVLIAVGIAILIIYYQDSGDVSRQRLVLIISGAILLISGIAYLIMTRITRKKQVQEREEEEEKKRINHRKNDAKQIENNDDVIDCTGEDSSNEVTVVDNEE